MDTKQSRSLANRADKGQAPALRLVESPSLHQPHYRDTLLRIACAAVTAALLIGVSVAFIDRPVATWVHQHLGDDRFRWATAHYNGSPLAFGPFGLMAAPAEALGPLAVLAFAALAARAAAGWRPRGAGRVALALCLSVLAASQITGVLKWAFGRTWPESWLGDNPSWVSDGAYGFFPFHGGLGWASFPSGHTTVVMAPAAILWVMWPELRVVWAALVAIVAAGLIGGNYHFVSDVIGGLFLGAGIGLGMAALVLPLARPPRPSP
jgi:membrane-associated phospholipid phosphatase